ncbi:MAG: tRNA epoxyqueuosine(34) reductase QueG [Anaerolineaceae bacterium]|nr:tRNA epoxyqueuosine(34) reductase QueG [Anaerolineaceae bacterium]
MTNALVMDDLARNIKAEAKRLGFSLVGITGLTPPAHFDVYRKWIEQGFHADMQYLSADYALRFRKDPLEYFPGGKTVICVGYSYPDPIKDYTSALTDEGRIAAYATIPDYHQTIPALLKKLVGWIKQNTSLEFRWKIATDTSPILEKELARQADLGWIGKNSCLINKDIGSYFLLGELFLTLELPTDDHIEKDYCGTCNRCLEACPTKCIQPDRTINSAKCISYHTIENKGIIPPEIRAHMDHWIFGCDSCQIVCPWNQKLANHTINPNAQIVANSLPLLSALRIDSEQFDAEFSLSPVKRATHAGFLRNVLAVLENSDSLINDLVLDSLLSHPEIQVRQFAISALWKSGSPGVRLKLQKLLENETAPIVRDMISQLLYGSQDGKPAF